MRSLRLSICLLMLALAVPAWAQFNCSVQGNAQDPSLALIPGVEVKIKNRETGVTQSTKTNDAGLYRFSSLAPGEYEISAQVQGFRPKLLQFSLMTGQNRDVNIPLEVNTSSESVEVKAEVPPLDTAETRLQLTLQQNKIRDLPLLNNSIFALLSLAPGVVGTNTAQDNFRPESNSGMSANGRSAYGNTFNVDGLSVTSNIMNGTSNIGVNPESVAEVAIETNTFKAEQGLGSSIVVSITTKSGTNEFHGAGNYWYTNQDMRARTSLPFVAKYAPFARQNVSGAFGGPVVKNKTFFFTSVEALRSKDSATSTETWESPQFVDWAKRTFPNTIGTKLLSDYPVKGPVITNPSLRTAKDILGAECGGSNTASIPCDMPMVVQGTWNRSPYLNGLQYNFRGDHYLRGGMDRINGTFIRTESDNPNFANRPGFNSRSSRYVNAFQANWTHTFKPTILNEFGFSGNKVLGADSQNQPFRIPRIDVQGSTSLGPGFAGTFVQHNYNLRDVVTWMKGSHTLKIGGVYYWGDDYADFPQANGTGSRPSYSFLNLLDIVRDQPFTANYSAYDPQTGKPKAYQFGARLNTFGVFVQDEWRVRPNITLTMSLRWDDFGNPSGMRDWKVTNLYLANAGSFDASVKDAYVKQQEHPFSGRLNKNFSPRMGIAWSPGTSRKWSVRGGIGLYNDWVTLGETVDRINVNPPNFIFPNAGVNLPLKPVMLLGTSDTYPFGFNLPAVAIGQLDSRGGIVGVSSGVGGLAADLTTPKTVNYMMGVERELPGKMVVGANYSGSRTWGALVGTNYNRFPGDLLDGTLNRLNPSFGSITYISNFNEMTYNAMILSAKKDLGARGMIQGSYTLGRVTDYFQGGSRSVGFTDVVDPRQMADRRADANFDIRQRISASGVYRLPTPWAGNVIAKNVLGGWELGSTLIMQTGTPYTITNNNAFNPIRDGSGNVIGFRPNSGDYNADGTNYDLPNVPANLTSKYGRDTFLGANAGKAAYKVADFTAPAIGTQGNSPRNYFRQQGLLSMDASVIKNNKLAMLGENFNLQLKFEFFNALNRVNLGGINANVADFNFGKILGQGQPRVVQIGARVSF